MTDTALAVTLAIITYRRPEKLERLLQTVDALVLGSQSPRLQRLLVIDNDPYESARSTVAGRSALHLPIQYFSETEPGVSAARNRAVAQCETPLLAFVDDDETVDPLWLASQLAEYDRSSPSAVVGSVEARLEESGSRWGRLPFFRLPSFDHQERINTLMSGNCIIDLTKMDERPLFAARYGVSGGEDHHLGARFAQRGHEIRHVADAKTIEWVPGDRAKMRPVLTRLTRAGNTVARVDLELVPTRATFLRYLVKGVPKAALLPVALPLFVLAPTDPTARVLRRALIGLGQLTALFRYEVQGYARPKGPGTQEASSG